MGKIRSAGFDGARAIVQQKIVSLCRPPLRHSANHCRAVCATEGCNELLELGWEIDAGLCVTCWSAKPD